MASPSPTRSSPALDRYLQHGSGSKSSHSHTIFARTPTKPKKFQSAHYDETSGTWRCKHCGYTYPNPEPHHHQRRAHKKICPGRLGKVHRWLVLSTGAEAEDEQDSSSVGYKPTTPESSDSVTTQRAVGQQAKNVGFEGLQISDSKFNYRETPSSNELPREIEIQELGDPKGTLSDQHRLMAAGGNAEAQRKEEFDSEPVTEDFNPRIAHFGRLLTLDSDVSLPHGFSLDKSDSVNFSRVESSDFVPATDAYSSGSQEGIDLNRADSLSLNSQYEAHSLKLGEDVLTADDALKRTEVAQGVQRTRLTDLAPENVGETFHQAGRSLDATIDDPQEKTADLLQQVQTTRLIRIEDGNAEESKVTTSEGFAETKSILQAAADDGALREKKEKIGSEPVIFPMGGDGAAADGALREKKEEIGSEQGIVPMGGDGAAADDGALREKNEDIGSEQRIVPKGVDGADYKSPDQHETAQLHRDTGDEEASREAGAVDQSGEVVHGKEEVDDLGRHAESAEVDAISLEPLSDDAEGVAETRPNTRTRPKVKLSSAERNWDDWEHVVSGDDTYGQMKWHFLPQEGPPVSEDRLTLSQSDNRADGSADTDAQMLEARGTAVFTSDHGGHGIGFQPADLDWTLASADTVNMDVDKEKPVDSMEGSTSADIHLSLAQDQQELIPEFGQETNQPKKVVLRLSAAEANWDDWEDVIKRVPMVMDHITLRREQEPESSEKYQTLPVDCLEDGSGLGQGKRGTFLEFESLVEDAVADMIEASQTLLEGVTLRNAQESEASGEHETTGVDNLGGGSGLGQRMTGIVSDFQSFVEGGVTDVIEAAQKLIEEIRLRRAQASESSGEYQTPQVDSLDNVSEAGQRKTGEVSEFESFVESGVTEVIKRGESLLEGISLTRAQWPETSGQYHTSGADSLGDVTRFRQEKIDRVSELKSFVEGGVAGVIDRGLRLLEGITFRKAQDPKASGVDSPVDGSELKQGKTGTSFESESFVEGGVIGTTAATGSPAHIPDIENSDWLIDFSEPSVEERNPGTANEEAICDSSPKPEVSGSQILDLLNLNERSGQEQGASLLESILVTPQSESGLSNKEVPSKLSSALRNWEDWDEVVTESERSSRPERSSPVLASDLGDGERESGPASPNRADSNIIDSGSKQAELVEPLQTPPVARTSDTSMSYDGLSPGKQLDDEVIAVTEEGDAVFSFPRAEFESKVPITILPTNLSILGSGQAPREGIKEMDDTGRAFRYEPVQAIVDNLWEDDWEVVQKSEYPSAGSRHSSPSFEDAHDGEWSSEHEVSEGLPTAVNLPFGKRRWADWEDLTKSEYMVLDGPDGESLVFKRTVEAGDKLSAKALGGKRETPSSFEEPDENEGGSPSLRRRRRQSPFFDENRSPSSRALQGTSPRGVVKSDYRAGSNSFQGFETVPRSLPSSSPRKSESGDLAPLITRRPLIYRGSRRDYASEVEDPDVISESPLGQRLHHHNRQEHEDALKYDVEKVLRGQTTYELICPICGASITRKIIIRKKRRFPTETDLSWRRKTSEITQVEDDGHRSPVSDMSSEIEDASGGWKQGIRPCFGYFFGS